MSSFANYLETKVLEHIVRKTELDWATTLTAVAAALSTGLQSDDAGTGWTEVANAAAYARQATTGATWGAAVSADPSTLTNAADIDFGAASGGNWGTIQTGALYDSATYGAGNQLVWGALVASKVVNDGDSFKFAIGDFDLTLN